MPFAERVRSLRPGPAGTRRSSLSRRCPRSLGTPLGGDGRRRSPPSPGVRSARKKGRPRSSLLVDRLAPYPPGERPPVVRSADGRAADVRPAVVRSADGRAADVRPPGERAADGRPAGERPADEPGRSPPAEVRSPRYPLAERVADGRSRSKPAAEDRSPRYPPDVRPADGPGRSPLAEVRSPRYVPDARPPDGRARSAPDPRSPPPRCPPSRGRPPPTRGRSSPVGPGPRDRDGRGEEPARRVPVPAEAAPPRGRGALGSHGRSSGSRVELARRVVAARAPAGRRSIGDDVGRPPAARAGREPLTGRGEPDGRGGAIGPTLLAAGGTGPIHARAASARARMTTSTGS